MTTTSPSGEHAAILTLPAPPLASVQGALALDLTPRLEPPRPALRPTRDNDLVAAPRPARHKLNAFAGRFLAAATEIAMGDRPVSQVLRHCTPEVHEDLSRRFATVVRAAGTSARGGRGPRATRPTLLGVRTSLVRPGALEASAHVRYGTRSRAIAARFEIREERWQCVVLEWGP